MIAGGVYAAMMHYLKAVDAVGDVKDGRKVVAKMKEMPTDDPLFGKGHILANGRKVHDVFVFQVKAPGSRNTRGISTNWRRRCRAIRPSCSLAESGCALK